MTRLVLEPTPDTMFCLRGHRFEISARYDGSIRIVATVSTGDGPAIQSCFIPAGPVKAVTEGN